jgi:hypothetical protein
MEQKTDYNAWSQKSLIERVTQLERELKEKNRRLIVPFPYLVQVLTTAKQSLPNTRRTYKENIQKAARRTSL